MLSGRYNASSSWIPPSPVLPSYKYDAENVSLQSQGKTRSVNAVPKPDIPETQRDIDRVHCIAQQFTLRNFTVIIKSINSKNFERVLDYYKCEQTYKMLDKTILGGSWESVVSFNSLKESIYVIYLISS